MFGRKPIFLYKRLDNFYFHRHNPVVDLSTTNNLHCKNTFKMNKLVLAVVLAVIAAAGAQTYIEDEVGAWHFHTYFFEVNPSKTAEAVAFR